MYIGHTFKSQDNGGKVKNIKKNVEETRFVKSDCDFTSIRRNLQIV